MFSRCFHNHAFLKRKVHTIVAYGDSNTWGFDPRSQFTAVRFPFQELWTTHLEGYLGKRYRVVNEGLNGRTTTVSRLSPSDGDYDCNGRMNIKNVLHTHKPLHTLIIALGANDLNPKFHQSPHDVVSSIRALVRDVKNSVDIGEYCEEIHHTTSFKSLTTKNVNIVIMGPPLMHANGISKVWGFDESITTQCRRLSALLMGTCSQLNIPFIPMINFSACKVDGVHFDIHQQKDIAHHVFHHLKPLLVNEEKLKIDNN